MSTPGTTKPTKRNAQDALAVLEQMFAYFSFEALPLEKPLHKAA
ncbi:hypothetical protein [Paracoccus aerodenitrificans]|nr:hypothetical protein [Paracoccus aerodenitrificans]WBU63088.1 hypothetical protein PAE61_12030 [Paracoccus aerodenitrificans]